MVWFRNLVNGLITIYRGFRLTLKRFRRGAASRRVPQSVSNSNYFAQKESGVTVQYPHETIPTPDVGRYRLHMEADDCIVCDQCARICPVDCITIEKIKAVDVIGLTSDGSKKRFWLPTFDIDMAKCCYCGLCTIVCPTECLTMTKAYDYSEYDRENMIYHFGNLAPEDAKLRQAELSEFEASKRAAKSAASSATETSNG